MIARMFVLLQLRIARRGKKNSPQSGCNLISEVAIIDERGWNYKQTMSSLLCVFDNSSRTIWFLYVFLIGPFFKTWFFQWKSSSQCLAVHTCTPEAGTKSPTLDQPPPPRPPSQYFSASPTKAIFLWNLFIFYPKLSMDMCFTGSIVSHSISISFPCASIVNLCSPWLGSCGFSPCVKCHGLRVGCA